MLRIDWIDAARGLGIVLVVVGHVEGGLVDAGIDRGALWDWLGYAIYTFHMPVFFLLAGLNVPASLAKGRGRFIHTKLWTILYPYIVWSLLQGSILVAMSSVTNGHTQPSELLGIGWHPMGQFWFLYALMACQLAAAAIGARPTLLAAVAVLSFAASQVFPARGIVEETLHSFPFFALGILITTPPLTASPAAARVRAAIALAGLVAFSLPSAPFADFNPDSALAFPAALCGIVFLVSLSQTLTGRALALACSLGRMSLAIYVMHVLAASGMRIALLKLHVPPQPLLYLALCATAGIAAPVAAYDVLRRFGLLAPFGLAPFRSNPLAPPSVTLPPPFSPSVPARNAADLPP